MNSNQNGRSGLGHYLQGVQHFGLTVYDLPKSLEFYLEVLGGKVAIGGDGFYGESLHNLLFQKEEVDALEKGIDPKSVGVANVRDGTDMALDVRFISFGNTVVEIIHFRDAKLTSAAPNAFEKIPASVGYTNAPHISFYVKDDVDIDVFAKKLEEECQRRGLNEVVVNRIIRANSPEEMRKLAPKFAKTDFDGDFDGWALLYCKGPNGEQLEFNQVTRKAKENFTRAEAEYNQANGTNYWFLNSQKLEANAQRLATSSAPVNAYLERKNIIESKNNWEGNTMTLTYSQTSVTTKSEIDPVFVFDNDKPQAKAANSGGSLTKKLEKMYEALHAENWDDFVTFFSPNLLYKIGANDPVIGAEACRDLLNHIYKTLKLTTHNTRGMWEIGNTIILEMDANYIHKLDKRFVQVPCVDIYRFDGDKIYEWRVYPDASQTGVRI